MRRICLAVAAAALLALPFTLALWPERSPAQGNKSGPPDARPGGAPASRLPITRVVLFTSGVGFFQRQGEVEDTASIDLAFPVADVNDLLKSLVLRDLGGGTVRAVSYDSNDPVEKTLRSFAVNLSGSPSFAQILTQARGEKVEVTLLPPGGIRPDPVTGNIVGVERQKQVVGKDAVVEVELLNLWVGSGMRSVRLPEVVQIRFLNPALDSEVQRALQVLARAHDTQKKTVTLSFSGKGKRQVQVGYVVEHPVWRTSYRLVLKGKGKPFLQGWALVENPTSEDWTNVAVRLVAGQPISFRMDLYEPLYVDRPLVQLERYAGLRPRAYEPALTPPPAPPAGFPPPREPPMDKKGYFKEGEAKAKNGPGGGGRDVLDIGRSVPSVAEGAQLGDFFHYTIDKPLSVARQKSALLPIVNDDVEATRVSIYNEATQAKHPLLGLKLKNTTSLHLMQGPITVFDEASYAGDALVRDVQPGEERLLSYAIDLATEVKTESKRQPEQLVSLKIIRGLLERTIKLRETKTYIFKNRADQDRLVILEHPSRAPDYKLISPTPKEPARDHYRFEVKVPRNGSITYPVVEEKEVLQEIVLTNADDKALALLVRSSVASPALKAALQKAIDLRGKWAAAQSELEQTMRQLKEATADQARQRENLKVIPQTDPAYRKYLDQFLAQEEQIRRLRAQQEQQQTTVSQRRRSFEEYLTNLTIKD
ncbi:MAG: DUF4139 domain-containing protein [Gemmataceae bacterium]|nr:DUF4139 domain-containing protein [Gemmataceae bacterium]